MPTNTQGGYSFHMAVDPASPGDGTNDIIYFGCVGQARSTDSGANFTGLDRPARGHARLGVLPAARAHAVDRLLRQRRRHLSARPTTARPGSPLNAGGLQTGALLQHRRQARRDRQRVTLGALQDNGLQTTAGAASPGWNSPQGGDGWDIAYDGATAGRAYGTSGFWSPAPCTRVWRSTNDGATLADRVTPWGTATRRRLLSRVDHRPTRAPPASSTSSGNQNLWQSQDGGATWRNIGAFPGNAVRRADQRQQRRRRASARRCSSRRTRSPPRSARRPA